MKLLEKQPYENARSFALRVLMQNIVTLELAPGSSISENELSAILKLSRTPVREALIELSKIGLVEILPQRGSYISKIDYAIIENSRFIRVSLENSIMKLACEGIDLNYIKILEENLKQQKESLEISDPNRFLDLDNEFHKLLFYSVKKELVYDFIKSQMVHFDRLRVLTLKSIKYQKNFEDHENILYAIKRKDGELAEMLMTKHLAWHDMDRKELVNRYPDYFTEHSLDK